MLLRIVLFTILLIICIIIDRKGKNAEKKMDENNFIVRPQRSLLFIGIFICAIIIFGIITYISINRMLIISDLILIIPFILPGLLGIGLIIYCLKCKLIVENNKIKYFPYFGKNIISSIEQIKYFKFKYDNKKIFAYNEDEKLLFIAMANQNGYKILISRLNKEGLL